MTKKLSDMLVILNLNQLLCKRVMCMDGMTNIWQYIRRILAWLMIWQTLKRDLAESLLPTLLKVSLLQQMIYMLQVLWQPF